MYIQAQIPNTLLPSTGISNLTFNIFFISLSLSQLKEQQHFYIGGDSGCHSVQLSSPSRRNLTGRPGFSEPFPEMLWKAPSTSGRSVQKGQLLQRIFYFTSLHTFQIGTDTSCPLIVDIHKESGSVFSVTLPYVVVDYDLIFPPPPACPFPG